MALHILAMDIPVMIGVALLCLLFFRSGYMLTCANGAIFLVTYRVYMIYLILPELQNQAWVTLQTILVDGLLSGLVLGVIIMTIREMQKERDIS